MARPTSRHPTKLELEILKILWGDGPASVREVRDALAPARDLAYTSVMTIMSIMTDKGYLKRAKKGGSYVYRPRITERTTTRRMLGDLVDRAFDGSAAAVMLNLLESTDLETADLEQLRELISRKMKESSE